MTMINDTILGEVTGLVRRMATRRGVPFDAVEDLLQDVYLKLLEKESDWQEGEHTFGAYCYGVAKRHADNWLLEKQWQVIPVPRAAGEAKRRAVAIEIRLTRELQRPPTQREIADEMGLSMTDYHKLMAFNAWEERTAEDGVDEDYDDDDGPQSANELEGDSIIPGPEHLALTDETLEAMYRALDSLPEKWQAILRDLYGLTSPDTYCVAPLSWDEVQEKYGFPSRGALGRMVKDALARMRARMPADLGSGEAVLGLAARVNG